MAIRFSYDPEHGYVVSKYEGALTDGVLLEEYMGFCESDAWVPGRGELIDLACADMSRVTVQGMRRLSVYFEGLAARSGMVQSMTAVFAPNDLPFGVARMYQAISEAAPADFLVFRDLQAARRWLGEPPTPRDSVDQSARLAPERP